MIEKCFFFFPVSEVCYRINYLILCVSWILNQELTPLNCKKKYELQGTCFQQRILIIFRKLSSNLLPTKFDKSFSIHPLTVQEDTNLYTVKNKEYNFVPRNKKKKTLILTNSLTLPQYLSWKFKSTYKRLSWNQEQASTLPV